MAVISPISGLKTWLNSGETIFGGDLNANFSILRGAFNEHSHSEFAKLIGTNASTANWNVSGNWNFSGDVQTSGTWLNSGNWTNSGLHSFDQGPVFRGPPTFDFTGAPFNLVAGTAGALATGLNAEMVGGLLATQLRLPNVHFIRPLTGGQLLNHTVTKPAGFPGLIIACSSSGGGAGAGLKKLADLGENGTPGGRLNVGGPVIDFWLRGGRAGRAWGAITPSAPSTQTGSEPANITAGVPGGRAGSAGWLAPWHADTTDLSETAAVGQDGGPGGLYMNVLPTTGGDITVSIRAPGEGGAGWQVGAEGENGNSGYVILMW